MHIDYTQVQHLIDSLSRFHFILIRVIAAFSISIRFILIHICLDKLQIKTKESMSNTWQTGDKIIQCAFIKEKKH